MNNLKFHNYYNLNINIETYYAAKYHLDIEKDNNNSQKLSTLFLDIEVYQENKKIPFRFDESNHPVSALSFSFKDDYYCYLYTKQLFDTEKLEKEFKLELINNNYITKEENIHIFTFDNDIELILNSWTKIKELNPCILSGFNSDNFDYPYIYRRLLKYDLTKTLSNFGLVEFNNNKVNICEFVICDLLYLYKPREDGGLNFGKKRPSYTLDYVSSEELKLKKLEYKNNLNEFYEKDPRNYLLYNLVDVILCKKLNDKLQHIELHNDIRRRLKNSFTRSLTGNSNSFESYILHENIKNNKYIRFGMSADSNKNISEEELYSFPKLIDKKKIIHPVDINNNDYSYIVNKFQGAHVNKSIPKIIKDGSLIIDLDAGSLYPSMMLQSNISYDVYRARILPPTTYKFLNILEAQNDNKINLKILQSIQDLCIEYVNKETITHKLETKRNLYYISCYLLRSIYKEQIFDIYEPKTDVQQFILQFYLIPFLDILTYIHPNVEGYNNFVYDYLFDYNNINSSYTNIYILENPMNTNMKIKKLPLKEALEYISNYSITITGTCFEKHDKQLGIFTDLLNELWIQRKKFEKKSLDFKEDSLEFNFYNSRQKSIKIIMNSIYGVFGLKSFKFSNHHLAASITSQGRLSIKLAQYITEQYLKTRTESR